MRHFAIGNLEREGLLDFEHHLHGAEGIHAQVLREAAFRRDAVRLEGKFLREDFAHYQFDVGSGHEVIQLAAAKTRTALQLPKPNEFDITARRWVRLPTRGT